MRGWRENGRRLGLGELSRFRAPSDGSAVRRDIENPKGEGGRTVDAAFNQAACRGGVIAAGRGDQPSPDSESCADRLLEIAVIPMTEDDGVLPGSRQAGRAGGADARKSRGNPLNMLKTGPGLARRPARRRAPPARANSADPSASSGGPGRFARPGNSPEAIENAQNAPGTGDAPGSLPLLATRAPRPRPAPQRDGRFDSARRSCGRRPPRPGSSHAFVRAAVAVVLALLGAFPATVPAFADPDALWRIVHGACVPHAEAGQGPTPCERVDLDRGEAGGVAILKDIHGVALMLAIPTRKIAGVVDPQMLAPDAPPAFADGWAAKPLLEGRLGHGALPREAVALTINSKWSRSQQQLHVHVDCVRVDVAEALKGYRSALDDQWRAMTAPLNGRVYFARRLDSENLADAEPMKLLADGLPAAKANMGAWTLAAVGATFGGKPGFILLAEPFSLEGGGHAEDLQDHDCAIAKLAP